jgi:hypothetical protein
MHVEIADSPAVAVAHGMNNPVFGVGPFFAHQILPGSGGIQYDQASRTSA